MAGDPGLNPVVHEFTQACKQTGALTKLHTSYILPVALTAGILISVVTSLRKLFPSPLPSSAEKGITAIVKVAELCSYICGLD